MQRKDLSEIGDLVAAQLPSSYEPLLLTFYGRGVRQSGDDVVIGDDYGTELRVRADGSVHSVDPKGEIPTRFMNSGISELAQFIEVISGTDRTDDEREREMWNALSAVDPPAFADDENWWAVVLEQVRLESGW